MNEENKIYIKKENIKKSKIPSYQRGYKWKAKNVKDLLNDIDSINNEDKKDHYIYSIINRYNFHIKLSLPIFSAFIFIKCQLNCSIFKKYINTLFIFINID